MPPSDTEIFIAKFLTELREDNAAVFIGAGFSKAAGFVDWSGLLAPLAAEIGLDASKESDLVGVAQYFVNAQSANRHQLSQVLIEQFADLPAPTDNHKILARLPIRTYWTTNYDRLLESAVTANGKRIDVKYTVPQLATTKKGRDVVLYKMHGDIEHPSQAVLTRDDYEKYFVTHDPFVTALSGDLVSKTFVFLGFSFTDPNLQYVMARIRVNFAQNQRQHFCITKRRSKQVGESDEEFAYASTRQNHMALDLMRFNVKTVFVDEYDAVTEILTAVETRYRLRTIFVGGSAAEFGTWGAESTTTFLARLSGALIKKDMRIATGFGFGIGGAVITGAVQEIYSTTTRSVDDQLIMRPFPIGIADPAVQKATFEKYREELLAQAGIAIFFFGNKVVDGKTAPANGLTAEFEMAHSRGLFVVPVGASGYVAEELWKRVLADFDKYYPGKGSLKPHFEALGKSVKSPVELLDPLLTLVDELSKG